MMIRICYFASVREQLGRAEEAVDLPATVKTVGDLAEVLAARGGVWSSLLEEKSVLIAVNQQISSRSQTLTQNDEVAFFPPMTGG